MKAGSTSIIENTENSRLLSVTSLMFPGAPEWDREISSALGVRPYLGMSCLPKFLLHEPIGYQCDEEGQEEVEKGHGEQETGEVSAGRGGRIVRVISL